MLVLGRKVGERIRIRTPAGDVWLTVCDVGWGRVRIGIDTPRPDEDWRIMREELLANAGEEGGARG
jgi:carbon storage regulator CsrA